MKYTKLILSSALFATLLSCNKAIDITETDLIAGPLALKSVTNCEQGLIGAYAGTSAEMDVLLNSTFSDEVKKAEFYNASTTHEWQFSTVDVGIRDNFTAITPNYVIIDRVNRVLQALPLADSTVAGDNAKRPVLRGEALFLRAYAHFELFRYYCTAYDPAGLGMPYLTVPSPTPTTPYARIKMDAYFQKIVADLAEAKNLVVNNLSDINRANKLAVAGLQARVALYMKDWNNAITYSTEYIAGKGLASKANFPGIWTDGNTEEQVFRIPRIATLSRMGSLWRGTSSLVSSKMQIGVITWQPTNKIWDSYDQVNDIRFAAYFVDEPLLIAAGRSSRLIKKYAGAVYGNSNENVANQKIFRTAEMYLIRAEARAEKDAFTGANSAESDINELRTNRINGYTPVTFASKAEALTAIVNERFKELAYEGHRFWDLKRRGLPVERIAAEAPTPAGTTLSAGNFRFALPIPNTEMQSNKLMEQNDGYK
jgi:hypothetical protein